MEALCTDSALSPAAVRRRCERVYQEILIQEKTKSLAIKTLRVFDPSYRKTDGLKKGLIKLTSPFP
ncbi:hypothetical protein BFS30_07945 [Pedobacter steynii]|uniref:Uncharacterized protein n=1 Tax=Pedobacter steynii TaxID=430522 RepID=A0A1D7QEJ9_9SPHI|nr:hypothetical protein BFS30_07945 [Pedobacter steynii]